MSNKEKKANQDDAIKGLPPKAKLTKNEKDKLLKELGRKLILDENFELPLDASKSDKKEYGVIIYYNGSVAPGA